MSQKFGLGRGLESLFQDNATQSSQTTYLRVSELEPNKDQPRKVFDDQALADLAASIREHGLLQPILVRPTRSFGYQIVAGERRWRASRLAGLETVPVIIREMSDEECMALALIENLQREDLNPVEEALGYQQLMTAQHYTQEQVADAVGKSRPAVANALRLLKLPEDILALLSDGVITAGHARAMLAIDDKDLLSLAVVMAKNGASVREIEKLTGKKRSKKEDSAPPATNFYKEVQLALTQTLGKKVRVIKGAKKSTLEIEFYSEDELTDLANLLGKNGKV